MFPTNSNVEEETTTKAYSDYEVADIFRRYGEEYRSRNRITKKQHKVISAIADCRTSKCGYHVDICVGCGYTENRYNSCHDRHCPKCQGISRRKWIDARLADLLPVSYYHVVFTLPHLLHTLISYNKALIYDLLFKSAAETLLVFGRDPKWLGGEIGFYGVLHTWGQTLWQHPHVHFIVSGGALAKDNRWVEPKYRGKFLFPVHALSKVFRGKFIEGLKNAYCSGDLIVPEDAKHLNHDDQFERWIDKLVARNWVVYCKRPFDNAENVIGYIGRYTHRVAISSHRIIYVGNGMVRFWYKDYKASRKIRRKMTLTAPEFIRRFLWHVLPSGFHKIRHFGFLSNGHCKAKIAKIREILGTKRPDSEDAAWSGICCPVCKKGKLHPFLIFNRFGHIIASFFKTGYAFDTS